MPDKFDAKVFTYNWVDDLILDSGFVKPGSDLVVAYTPDTLHLGYETYPLAIKNRRTGFMVVPDARSTRPCSSIAEMSVILNQCDLPRKVVALDANGEYDWVEVENKIWMLAPVDVFTPQLATCDLATLSPCCLAPLDRLADHLIRRYLRTVKESDVKQLDRYWETLDRRYRNLGLGLSEDQLERRQVAIVRARLKS